MKKFSFIFLIAFFLSVSASARIWRVNNMPGVTADFTTAQAAHNGANAGDTIHLEPSVNNYGEVICTKKLVWLSIGNFLTQNPGNQFSTIPGKLSTMTFNAGSQGSVVSVVSDNFINIYTSSISVLRSYLEGSVYLFSSIDAVISQCYIIAGVVSLDGTNTIFSNNIVPGIGPMNSGNSAIITNNVFTTTSGAVYGIYNSVFQNNIQRGGGYNFFNSLVSYNMHAGTYLPAGNNNQLNVNMTTVFVNDGIVNARVDKDYQLKVGSPAIASGYGGIDMGAFGGSTAFKLALQPAIPAITNLSTPSSSGGNTIQVIFSAISNN